MWFKKNEYKKFKRIVLIDTENVGFKFPNFLNKDILYIYFKNKNKKNKANNMNRLEVQKNIKIFEFRNESKTKNAMDFCIVSELGNIVEKNTNRDAIYSIISKDKGYDVAIDYLNSKYGKTFIFREDCLEYVDDEYMNNPFLRKITRNLEVNPEMKLKFEKVCSLSKLKKAKNKNDVYTIMGEENFLKATTLETATINNKTYCLKFNLFEGCYMINGVSSDSYEEAYKRFNKVKQNVILYPNSTWCKRAKFLDIHQFVLESFNTQVPLHQVLINNLGVEEGCEVFQQFVTC